CESAKPLCQLNARNPEKLAAHPLLYSEEASVLPLPQIAQRRGQIDSPAPLFLCAPRSQVAAGHAGPVRAELIEFAWDPCQNSREKSRNCFRNGAAATRRRGISSCPWSTRSCSAWLIIIFGARAVGTPCKPRPSSMRCICGCAANTSCGGRTGRTFSPSPRG